MEKGQAEDTKEVVINLQSGSLRFDPEKKKKIQLSLFQNTNALGLLRTIQLIPVIAVTIVSCDFGFCCSTQ